MWSYVGATATARWLWHAIDHHSGKGLAYVVGTRKDATFLKLQAFLAPLALPVITQTRRVSTNVNSRPNSTP